jgi:Mg-chelatase subunit ChlD
VIPVGDLESKPARSKSSKSGRHRSKKYTGKGRYIRAGRPDKRSRVREIALDATLRAVAGQRLFSHRFGSGDFALSPNDLRIKVRSQLHKSLIVFAVDASESMGAERRMRAAKGAVLGLLTRAYQKRDSVSVIAFGGEVARILLHPTRSISLAKSHLRELPVGGATPFAHGLVTARQVIASQRCKNPALEPILVIISDGEANVPLDRGTPVNVELFALARRISKDGYHVTVIDTNSGRRGSKTLIRLADIAGARYHHIRRISSGDLVEIVRDRES